MLIIYLSFATFLHECQDALKTPVVTSNRTFVYKGVPHLRMRTTEKFGKYSNVFKRLLLRKVSILHHDVVPTYHDVVTTL